MNSITVNTCVPSYSADYYDHAIVNIYQQMAEKKIDTQFARINFLTQLFLGEPYVNGALGEGHLGRFDQNPLYRTDAFDCVTFVNTVLALTIAKNLQNFKEIMTAINYYQATAQYQYRYHFMNLDWNRQNQKLGVIAEVTEQICNEEGQSLAERSQTIIDRPNWFRRRTLADIKLLTELSANEALNRLNELHQLADSMVIEMSELAYIPIENLFLEKLPKNKFFSQMPDLFLVEIVRSNWDLQQEIGTKLDVSHVGFALRIGNKLIFRHASSRLGKVQEIELQDYLLEIKNFNSKVSGINLQKIQDISQSDFNILGV